MRWLFWLKSNHLKPPTNLSAAQQGADAVPRAKLCPERLGARRSLCSTQIAFPSESKRR